MRTKGFVIILLVIISFSQWHEGFAQEYYDLYSNNEFYREKKHDIQSEHPAVIAPTSSSPSLRLLSKPPNYNSHIGHPASPTPMRVNIVVALLSAVAVVFIIVVMWLIHLVRKSIRKRTLIRQEFAMTTQDTELSSTALGSDPYKSVSRRASYELFTIPMPDEPRQTASYLAPQISLTSAAGKTTNLYP